MKMGDLLKKVLDLSVKFGFLKNLHKNSSFLKLSFGPLSVLLANNIYSEWFQNNTKSSELNTFSYSSSQFGHWKKDCQLSYQHALQVTSGNLPFGLVSFLTNYCPSTLKDEPNGQFHSPTQDPTNAYRCLTFIDQKDSQQYFYRLQSQRKMWWRKFSNDPERFNIVEDKYGDNEESVQISAKFPWSTEILEVIQNHKSEDLFHFGSTFEAKAGRKKQLPHVIECVCLESPAVMTYLYDSFQQLPARTLLRLHPSLAPYKIAFVIDSSDNEMSQNLYQMAKYLNFSLRKAKIHTLFSPAKKSKKGLETHFSTHDSIGIPYSVVMSSDTLNNGIVSLRSRDTTLQEQVHMSKLATYMQKMLGKL